LPEQGSHSGDEVLHGTGFLVCFRFWEEALDWNTKSTINFLAGSIAWLFGLVMWVTAINWVRRSAFEVRPAV
jgi:hypothetical protein